MIEKADPGKLPRLHKIRNNASTLAFMCSDSLDLVQEVEQWRSVTSFCTGYVAMIVEDTPCVAVGMDGDEHP